MASSYDWHPSTKGQSVFKVETRNLGWWVLLAIFISVIVHVILYMVLGGIRRSSMGIPAQEVVWQNTREQLKIDQEELNRLLEEPFIPEDKPLEPEKLSDLDLVDNSLDEFDLMEQMKDEIIRMSPIETPQVFSGEARWPREATPIFSRSTSSSSGSRATSISFSMNTCAYSPRPRPCSHSVILADKFAPRP